MKKVQFTIALLGISMCAQSTLNAMSILQLRAACLLGATGLMTTYKVATHKPREIAITPEVNYENFIGSSSKQPVDAFPPRRVEMKYDNAINSSATPINYDSFINDQYTESRYKQLRNQGTQKLANAGSYIYSKLPSRPSMPSIPTVKMGTVITDERKAKTKEWFNGFTSVAANDVRYVYSKLPSRPSMPSIPSMPAMFKRNK